MMDTAPSPTRPGSAIGRQGFTLLELLIYLVLGVVAIGGITGVLVSQSRLYGLQREIIDARESLRGAAAVLVDEVQNASADRNDLSGLEPHSLTLRSTQATGVVCSKHATAPRYGLKEIRGTFTATTADSVLFYDVDGKDWRVLKINQVSGDHVTAGVPLCAWSGSPAPDLAVELLGDTSGIEIGSAVHGFRQIKYGLVQQGDRWWLGRQAAGSSTFGIVTGPMRPAAEGGLVFSYLDESGAITADSSRVRRVGIEVRAESFAGIRTSRGVEYRRDSIKVSAFLRH